MQGFTLPGIPLSPFFARQSLAIFLLSSVRRKKQRSIHPLQGLPLYGEDAICFGQRPAYAKVLVSLAKPVP